MIELLLSASLLVPPSVPSGTPLTDMHIEQQRHYQTLDQMDRMRDPTNYQIQREVFRMIDRIDTPSTTDGYWIRRD